MQRGAIDTVRHRIQIRCRTLNDVGKTAKSAISRDDSIQMHLVTVKRPLGIESHPGIFEEIGPPVRASIGLHVERAPKVDPDGGGSARWRVGQCPEDGRELRKKAMKLRIRACPRHFWER